MIRADSRDSKYKRKRTRETFIISYIHLFFDAFPGSLSHSSSSKTTTMSNTRMQRHRQQALSNVDKNLVIFIFNVNISHWALNSLFSCVRLSRSAFLWRHSAIDAITNYSERWLFSCFFRHCHSIWKWKLHSYTHIQASKAPTETIRYCSRNHLPDSWWACCWTDGYSAHGECKSRLDTDKSIIIERK